MRERERVDVAYRELLPSHLLPQTIELANNNFSYFPVLLVAHFRDQVVEYRSPHGIHSKSENQTARCHRV